MIPKRWFVFVLVGALLLVGCNQQSLANNAESAFLVESDQFAEATFAGGCFWCMEKPFDALPGVIATTSGYTGGETPNPTYQQVSSGRTGHAEAVRVIYDPDQVNYNQLLDVFWKNVDPVDEGGQFCDRGNQYRTGIFYHDDAQKQAAEASKQSLIDANVLPKPIVTPITKASDFFAAEAYHQNYYQTNPVRYKAYRFSCGRDQRLNALWGES